MTTAFVNDLSIYKTSRKKMRTGDLLQWRGNYTFSRIIRRHTGEQENHSSLVVRLSEYPNRVFSIEAKSNGLHLWPLSSLLQRYDGSVNWYPIRDEYFASGAANDAARWLLAHLGVGYDFMDCLSNWRTILGIDPDPADAKQLYCSESVFLAFRDKWYDEMSEMYVGAGLPHLQDIKIAPVPGRPMANLNIWSRHAAVAVLLEHMRTNFGEDGKGSIRLARA